MSKFIPSANDDHLIMVTAQPQKGWIRLAVNTFMIMLIFMQWHKQQVCNKYQYSFLTSRMCLGKDH